MTGPDRERCCQEFAGFFRGHDQAGHLSRQPLQKNLVRDSTSCKFCQVPSDNILRLLCTLAVPDVPKLRKNFPCILLKYRTLFRQHTRACTSSAPVCRPCFSMRFFSQWEQRSTVHGSCRIVKKAGISLPGAPCRAALPLPCPGPHRCRCQSRPVCVP